ncbi:MAG: maleylpyruvate isomerase N-terminal domain-containing protein [Acidimicrobiales bacterium]
MTPDDLLEAVSTSRRALEPFVARDWSVRAGDLDWDVRTTVAHACDAVGWYAAHLALQSPRRLRLDFRAHPDASNAELLDVLAAAAATLAGMARSAPPSARAYHDAGMADTSGFLAMGCDEVLVHGWDAVRSFGVELAAPADLAERVLCRLFPWAPTDEPCWPTLLWANGRADLPTQKRLGPDWVWHCAPLEEWDGTVPRRNANPPSRYEWDRDARRWRPFR